MAFTAQEIINVYLFRWQMQEMTTMALKHLRPSLGFIEKLVGEKGKAGWDEKVRVGEPIRIRVPKWDRVTPAPAGDE